MEQFQKKDVVQAVLLTDLRPEAFKPICDNSSTVRNFPLALDLEIGWRDCEIVVGFVFFLFRLCWRWPMCLCWTTHSSRWTEVELRKSSSTHEWMISRNTSGEYRERCQMEAKFEPASRWILTRIFLSFPSPGGHYSLTFHKWVRVSDQNIGGLFSAYKRV